MTSSLNNAYLLLGSNIDPERNLAAAVRLLALAGEVTRISRVWESPPVDGSAQPDYLNAAVLFRTDLGIRELRSSVIANIEQTLVRQRDPDDRYAARTIDVDVVLFNRDVIEIDGRPLPDPEIMTRPFVAIPLAEVDPEYVHPTDGRTLAAIAATFDQRIALKCRDDVRLLGEDRPASKRHNSRG